MRTFECKGMNLPKEYWARLKELSTEQDRSVNALIRIALEQTYGMSKPDRQQQPA